MISISSLFLSLHVPLFLKVYVSQGALSSNGKLFWESDFVVKGHTIVELHPIQHAELGDGPDIALNGGTLLVSRTYLRKLLLLY